MTDERTPDIISRRALVRSAGVVAGAAFGAPLLAALAQRSAAPSMPPPPLATPLPALVDPSTAPGMPSEALGARSMFETPALAPVGVTTGSAYTPLQKLSGTITPSDLHFQRHHNGIAVVDPASYRLVIHGMVDRPLEFTLDDLRRFPSVTRPYFIDCAGNGRSAYRAPKPEMTPQDVDGLTSNSEWTGVLVSTLLREAGVRGGASWVLAEGADADKLSRSIPIAKMLDDAMVAYAQNGEPLRTANGYPARLVVPGYEGNMNVKWLRRLEAIAEPNMSRDETAKYTDPLPDGTSRQFSFVMDVKSVITSPAHPERLASPGWQRITGLAWSGRGRISRVEVSTDGGAHWMLAELAGPVHPRSHTRFELMWNWTGGPAALMSRAVDETGAVQPLRAEFEHVRGVGTDYHFNHVRTWTVGANGEVHFGG